MAFEVIAAGSIIAGKPVTQDLWSKTKNSFDDHEDRIDDLEQTIVKFAPIQWDFFGNYSEYGSDRSFPVNNIGLYYVTFPIDLLGCTLMLHDAGTAGTTKIDIEAYHGGGWSSIFGSGNEPAISTYTDYDVDQASPTALSQLIVGDKMRLKLVSAQSGSPSGFSVFLTYGIT